MTHGFQVPASAILISTEVVIAAPLVRRAEITDGRRAEAGDPGSALNRGDTVVVLKTARANPSSAPPAA